MGKRKYKTCQQCQREYYGRNGKFCNEECMQKWFGKGSRTFWETATDEEKWERTKKLYERNVIRYEGCWDWKGSVNGRQYTRLQIGPKKTTQGHIVSWKIYKGDVPEGKIICHKCDNRRCTNPDHLFIGTFKDNTQDMMTKNRQRWRQRYILDEEKVREIKKLLSLGVTCNRLAKDYGVNRATISLIKSGKNWKNVTLETTC